MEPKFPNPARLARLLALSSVLTMVLHCVSPTVNKSGESTPSIPVPTRLEPGTWLDRALETGEIHTYALNVPAGHFVWMSAIPGPTSLEIYLTGPGQPPHRWLLPSEGWRPQSLGFVVESAGTWTVEVRRRASGAGYGRYELGLEDPRPATRSDEVRVAAWQALGKGRELAEGRSREGDEQALAELLEALRLWRLLADRKAEAVTLHWIGVVQTDLGLYADAEQSLEAMLSLEREFGRRPREADALFRLGNLEYLRGRYDRAVEQLERALAFYRELDEPEPAAFTLMHLGYTFKRRTDLQAALDRYHQALDLLRPLELWKWQANVLNNIGSTLQSLGEFDDAREYFAEALPISRDLGDQPRQVALLNNIGWGLKAQGKTRASVPYLEEALEIAKKLADDRTKAIILDNIGRAYLDLNEPQTTLRYSQQALELCRLLDDPRGQAVRLNTLGMAYHLLQEPRETGAHFEEALSISRRIGNRKNESVALHGLARLHRSGGDLEAAQQRIHQALDIAEQVRTTVGSLALKASYLGSRHGLYEFLVDLLVERARQQPDRRQEFLGAALSAHERARARSLLESLTESLVDIRSQADPELLRQEAELREKLNELERQRLMSDGRRQEGSEAASVRRDLLAALEDIGRRIRLNSPRYEALTAPRTLQLEEIQQQVLDGQSLLLEYALGEERSHLFAVTTDTIEVFELPARSQIEALAREAYGYLAQGPDGFGPAGPKFRLAMARLSRILLDPLADRLTEQRLLLVAEGALHYVPFAALEIPGDSGEGPLIVRHEIVRLASASATALLRQRVANRPTAPLAIAVMADPVFSRWDPRVPSTSSPDSPEATVSGVVSRWMGRSQIQRLESSREEAQALAEMVPDAQRFVALDFEASRLAALDPAMGSYRILHFATHGLLDNRTPELSGLVFSLYDQNGADQDGFLRLHDIYNLELNAGLVVLSACQTALGKAIRGEGLIGLTRGFLYAGAERVVASLWQVDDRATADLMRRFYHGMLRRQLTPAAALRAAQIEMWRGEATNDDWRQPYYWAAFALHGEWRRAVD